MRGKGEKELVTERHNTSFTESVVLRLPPPSSLLFLSQFALLTVCLHAERGVLRFGARRGQLSRSYHPHAHAVQTWIFIIAKQPSESARLSIQYA